MVDYTGFDLDLWIYEYQMIAFVRQNKVCMC